MNRDFILHPPTGRLAECNPAPELNFFLLRFHAGKGFVLFALLLETGRFLSVTGSLLVRLTDLFILRNFKIPRGYISRTVQMLGGGLVWRFQIQIVGELDSSLFWKI